MVAYEVNLIGPSRATILYHKIKGSPLKIKKLNITTMILWLICLVMQIVLAVEVFRRNDLTTIGKLLTVLIIVLVPYMIGATFYYFYAKNKVAAWFK